MTTGTMRKPRTPKVVYQPRLVAQIIHPRGSGEGFKTLTISTKGVRTRYAVAEFIPDHEKGRAFRLLKFADRKKGEIAIYDVFLAKNFHHTCECLDFVHRQHACKHIESLTHLILKGKL